MLIRPSRVALEKACKKLWPQAVYLVNGRYCGWQSPSRKGKHGNIVQPHHVVPKGRCKHLSFSVVNGFPLCKECHFFITSCCGELDFVLWYSENYPDRWKYLQENRHKIVKIAEHLEEWHEELKRVLEHPEMETI